MNRLKTWLAALLLASLPAAAQQPAYDARLIKGAASSNVNVSSASVTRRGATTTVSAATDPSTNGALIAWALVQAFAVTSATRNANGAITTASIIWPDGATGVYTATTLSSTCTGATDAWSATYVLAGVTTTVTQSAVTRDANCAVVTQPTLTLS